ncbi:hypothetical protein acsn021_25670 [Anaerocolumna cellulosilytica]|uniref:Uncharacterized protein n=1 Tax=Anaerocolumna cellulosilytica TaxID=433286 RepID=A0A6S6R7K9_9FIRM|nr:hypothetical protein [Anaerocolumna cellulosilytica]MBB5193785.1 hypothetical protein [Anaerocolumna cellulosilytica]BCJ94998.1 hypothetical protein acsn021_25670 [Anaerocolumna cellulosilytica]
MEQKRAYSQESLSQAEYQMPSRAEYIRVARESCTRNLGLNHGSKSHSAKEKDKYLHPLSAGQDVNSSKIVTGSVPLINIKVLLIRIVCAAFLFLAVFLIDTFEVSYKSFSSKYIKELVTMNRGVEEAQDFIVAIFENLTNAEKEGE